MTTLHATSIKIATSTSSLDARQLLGIIQQLFPADALCLCQSTHKVVLAPLQDIDLETDWLACTSCIVCSTTAELRAEKGAFEDRAHCRLVLEGEGLVIPEGFVATTENCLAGTFVRKNTYLLHGPIEARHARIHAAPEWGKEPKLAFKEYFSPDSHGWLQFQAGCFAGIAKGGQI